MLLVLILFIPVVAAALVLMFKSRRVATAFAVAAGVLETVGLAATVWRGFRTGGLVFGEDLPAETFTTIFFVNLGGVFFFVLVLSTMCFLHIPAGRVFLPG